MKKRLSEIFFSPINNNKKKGVVLLVASLFIFFPQTPPIDWELNTIGFWSDILHTYKNPNFVYPPWGLILMFPYHLVQAEGARFFSVLVTGWLCIQQKWSLSLFLSIVLSPYFFVTMSKSNMDIFVFVLPLLIWRASDGRRWQRIGRGTALSILLLKPQGALLTWLYLIWTCRKKPEELVVPLIMVALIIIPVSLIGSPPLILQWLENISNPSPQNQFYWSMNNVSLSARFTFPTAILTLLLTALAFFVLVKKQRFTWHNHHILAAFYFISLFLSPYASQQSVSAAMAFVPSWASTALQAAGLAAAFYSGTFFDYLSIWILLFAIGAFFFSQRNNPRSGQTVEPHESE